MMLFHQLIFIFLLLMPLLLMINGHNQWTESSLGEAWPKPQWQWKSPYYFILRPGYFEFIVRQADNCKLLMEELTNRYWLLISGERNLIKRGRYRELKNSSIDYGNQQIKFDKYFQGFIDSLYITINGTCNDNEYPDINSQENYSLKITGENYLEAPTIWGIMRGLETFSQLVYYTEDAQLLVNITKIQDYPRFPHRGLLLDTSRHYIPYYSIINILDAMSYNKMNVFHWHMTDDQSFPYQSKTFPELSEKGAYHPISKIYQQHHISNIIDHARRRGIRVIPEFDSPGHTLSWTRAYPQLQTICDVPEIERPLDPINENTYEFLEKFFKEIWNVFPDKYIHLGGDEVNFTCWQRNDNITRFMKRHNIKRYEEVENYYIQRLLNITANISAEALVWEEVFVNGVNIKNSTIVQIWKSNGLNTIRDVTSKGHKALFSSCWYLDHLGNGGDWIKYYDCDPHDFKGTTEQKKLVIGGEACMWSEVVNEYNVISRIWPRASAAAEKLWSAQSVNDTADATRRLEEHTCRMNRRGIGAQPPTGPGVCL